MNLEEILYSRTCWVCGAELKDDEGTVCKFYHRNKKSPDKALDLTAKSSGKSA